MPTRGTATEAAQVDAERPPRFAVGRTTLYRRLRDMVARGDDRIDMAAPPDAATDYLRIDGETIPTNPPLQDRWIVELRTCREVESFDHILELTCRLRDGPRDTYRVRRRIGADLVALRTYNAQQYLAQTIGLMLRDLERHIGERLPVGPLIENFILARNQEQIDRGIAHVWEAARAFRHAREPRDADRYRQRATTGMWTMGYDWAAARGSASMAAGPIHYGGPRHHREPTISIGQPNNASERRAQVLLYKTIGKRAFRRYRAKGYHDVLGPKSGVWYRLKKGAMIDILSGQHQGCRLCIGPRDPVPSTDILMSQLLTILGDEEGLWKVANHWPGGGPGAHWDRKTKCRGGGREY